MQCFKFVVSVSGGYYDFSPLVSKSLATLLKSHSLYGHLVIHLFFVSTREDQGTAGKAV